MTRRHIIIVFLLLLLLKRHRRRRRPVAIRYALYTATPLTNIERMLSQPGTFRSLLRFEPEVFLNQLAVPLFPHCSLPRGYLARADYRNTGYVSRRRRCQIPDLDRLARFLLRMRGVPRALLAHIYDQDPTTVWRDLQHVAALIFERLQPLHLRNIVIGSAEYLDKVGNRAFRHFPNALYAVDVVTCTRRRPDDVGHSLYYDGYKHHYNYGFLVNVDCDGLARNIHGHFPGSINDIESYYFSDLYRAPQTYFGPTDRMLADGIFARVPGPFIVPVSYLQRNLTLAEVRYNEIQRWDRSIVEHYFARLKLYFPIVNDFPFESDRINLFFTCCVVLCNVLIRFQSPLRK